MRKLNEFKYCNDMFCYIRLNTHEVKCDNIAIGGNNPIRIQTMTNTQTADIEATISQCLRIIESGAELIRITVPTLKDVEHFKTIKQNIRKQGYEIPLVADVHFSAKVAIACASVADKVRINPGNFIDKKKSFKTLNYSDEGYQTELEKLKSSLLPYIKACKKHQTATRIGTNHGSLSDRILNRYGDTPEGMVESTMEFLRIFKAEDYNEIIISLKASNTKVMVHATRLLVKRMKDEEMNYPLHLGVTEAGDGEDGRIKSAVGIGTLLVDGIGDTIRVSLTEEPEKEIPVAKAIVESVNKIVNHKQIADEHLAFNPFEYKKRETIQVGNIGGSNPPVVIAYLSDKMIASNLPEAININFNTENHSWEKTDCTPDYIILESNVLAHKAPGFMKIICPFNDWKNIKDKKSNLFPLFTIEEYLNEKHKSGQQNFVKLTNTNLDDNLMTNLKNDNTVVLLLTSQNQNRLADYRASIMKLMNRNINNPVILWNKSDEANIQSFQIEQACNTGGLFIDGLAEGILLEKEQNAGDISLATKTAFHILQATRSRIFKTEYISCPGCGRTLFDLQTTTQKIKSKTSHLKGLKIGIMGCIVNGIGEMADADYGYVGSGKGKISLYKSKKLVKKNLDESSAVDALINLIKNEGDWHDL